MSLRILPSTASVSGNHFDIKTPEQIAFVLSLAPKPQR